MSLKRWKTPMQKENLIVTHLVLLELIRSVELT